MVDIPARFGDDFTLVNNLGIPSARASPTLLIRLRWNS